MGGMGVMGGMSRILPILPILPLAESLLGRLVAVGETCFEHAFAEAALF